VRRQETKKLQIPLKKIGADFPRNSPVTKKYCGRRVKRMQRNFGRKKSKGKGVRKELFKTSGKRKD